MTDFAPIVTYLNDLLIQRGQGVSLYEFRSDRHADLTGHFAKRIARLATQITILETAIEAGQIANPVYRDLADILNRTLEDAWSVFGGYPYPTLYLIPGMLRKAEKGSVQHTFLSNVLPLSVVMKTLKDEGRVIKRQPKPVEDVKAKYLAPRAGLDAAALVQQALIQVTVDNYQKMLGMITERYQMAVSECLTTLRLTAKDTLTSEQVSKYNREQGRRFGMADQILWEMVDQTDAKRAATIVKKATRDADEIRDAFIVKNLKKLDSIVERKGDFAAIKIIGQTVSMWSLQGEFLISFKDGSSFETRNSVVGARSMYNKIFQRFPLTFHNATLADGSKMARPSEERINTVFCGKE